MTQSHQQKEFKIVGAGFSGLSLAWYLAKSGYSVSIYEKENRCGGLLGTTKGPFGIAEKAANGIMASDLLLELLNDLGIEPEFSREQAKKRFIERNGPKRFPLKLLEALELFGKLIPLIWRGKSLLKPIPGETLSKWGKRCLGAGATRWLISPAMNGIYAGDISKMSASLIINGLLFNKPKSKVRGLVSFKGGMQELVDALECKLNSMGVKIFLNSDVDLKRELEKQQISDHSGKEVQWILATSAWSAANVLKGVDDKTSLALAKIETLPLISSTAFFEKPIDKVQGFGCLFADAKRTAALGVLMNSHIYNNRGPKYSETWIFGGAFDQKAFFKTDEDIKNEILNTRKSVFEDHEPLLGLSITRWPQALPHYTLEVEKSKDIFDKSKIQLHGNYIDGIGLTHILSRSEKLSKELTGQKKRAILFVNVGTPKSYQRKDVKRYLGEFLMDKKVIGAPFLVRWVLVQCIIKPFRSGASSQKYKKIWTEDGSPLKVISDRFLLEFQKQIPMVPSFFSMRYGEQNIQDTLSGINREHFDQLCVVPLYPQYASATTESTVNEVQRVLKKNKQSVDVKILEPFYNKSFFINPIADKIRGSAFFKHLVVNEESHVLFSYHGLPVSQVKSTAGCDLKKNCLGCDSIKKSKCYYSQCLETSKSLGVQLELPALKYSTSFQSRLGPTKWLEPSTEETLIRLAKSGVKNLIVVCPAFVADCLETLEEINIHGRQLFLENGGENFEYISCLNDDPEWIRGLSGNLISL